MRNPAPVWPVGCMRGLGRSAPLVMRPMHTSMGSESMRPSRRLGRGRIWQVYHPSVTWLWKQLPRRSLLSIGSYAQRAQFPMASRFRVHWEGDSRGPIVQGDY